MGSETDSLSRRGVNEEAHASRFEDPALSSLDFLGDLSGSGKNAASAPSAENPAKDDSRSKSAESQLPKLDLVNPEVEKFFPDLWIVWKDSINQQSKAAPLPDLSPPSSALKPKESGTGPQSPADMLQKPRLDAGKDGASLTGFESISSSEAERLLANAPGEDLPPIAKRFEQYGLSLLTAEEKSENLRAQIYVSKTGRERFEEKIPHGATIYKSIQEAVDKAPANSVINVMPDIYREKIALKSDIVLKTDPNNPAVIDNGKRTTGKGTAPFSIESNVSNVGIKNFEIRNFDGSNSGIEVRGSNIKNITLSGNNLHSARGAEGIGVYGEGSVPISNVKIISNRLHDLQLRGQIEALPINGNVSDFKIIGNSGYRLKNLFIDVINGEGHGTDGPRGGTIAYNFADRITTVGNPDYDGPSSAGIYSDAGRDLNIYGNYVRNSDFGIEIGSEHARVNSSDVRVHGNIFESSGLAWLKLGYIGNVNNSTFNNNLVVGNSAVERGNVGSKVVVSGNHTTAKRNQIDRLPAELMSVLK